MTFNWRKYTGAVIFGLGVGGAIHEMFFATDERPYILGFIALLLGIVGGTQIDKNRQKKDEEHK